MFNSQSGFAYISLKKQQKQPGAVDGDLVAKWQSRISTPPNHFAAAARLDHHPRCRVSYAKCIVPIGPET
jgi:hypothetical protein